MLRGERRFPSALLRARERVGRPFTCLRYRVDRPFRHVRKEADHATRSTVKIKKRRVSYSLIIGSARRLRFGERDKRVRHVLTYGIKRFELVHQHVLNYV